MKNGTLMVVAQWSSSFCLGNFFYMLPLTSTWYYSIPENVSLEGITLLSLRVAKS
jgi:hypothetical protein